MSSINLILQDGHREAILTATSEAGTLAIENTQNDSRALLWRSEASSAGDALTQEIDAIMPVTISSTGGIALAYSNLTTSATVTATLKNGTGTVDTVTLDGIENLDGTTTWEAWFTVDDQVDQYTLNIADPTNPDGYLQAARIICGPAITLGYCASPGVVIEYIQDVEHLITDALSVRSEGTGAIRREATLDLNLVSTDERADFIASLATDGRGKSAYISLYHDRGDTLETAGAFVAKRMEDLAFNHWKGPGGQLGNRFRAGLVFREV